MISHNKYKFNMSIFLLTYNKCKLNIIEGILSLRVLQLTPVIGFTSSRD